MYMNALDRIMFYKFQLEPKFRVDLEDKLEYLRTYGCFVPIPGIKTEQLGMPGHTEIDIERNRVEMHSRHDPLFFDVRFTARTDMGVYRQLMIGGLVFHGPKIDFNERKEPLSQVSHLRAEDLNIKSIWGVHT